MKGEKRKLILVYILMLLVIVLIASLTYRVLIDSIEEKPKDNRATTTPMVDVNPYPNISDECTFDLTLDEYNALTGPMCKNGYSRYNVSNVNVGGNTIPITVIYSDLDDSNKEGVYINDRKFTTIVDDVINIKFAIFDEKLFTLDTNNNEANVLAFSSDAVKLYDLKETLDSLQIADPAFQNLANQTISSTTIDPHSFRFTDTNFTFKAQSTDSANQVISGSTYQVTFNGDEFSNPEFITMN